MKYVFLLWFVCLLSSALNAEPVPLQHVSQTYDLFKASSLLEVRPGQVTIDSLLHAPGRYSFVPTRNSLIVPYDRQRAYWFRVDLTNLTSETFFLHAIYSGTERIKVYEVANNQVIAQHHLGRFDPLVGRSFQRSLLYCPLLVRADRTASGQTHTLYIYMEGIYTTCLYFYGQSAPTLLEAVHNKDLFYGLYYGFILMIVAYSLIMFIRLRDQDTIRYAVWVTCIGIQLALYRGYTGEYLWPNTPSIERYATALAGVSGILHVLFTISFLRLQKKSSWFYRIGIGMIAAYLIGIIVNLFTVYAATQTSKQLDWVPQIALFEGIFSVTAGIVTYRRGFKPALFYFVGNLVFFFSIFIFLLYAGGQLPHSFWSYNSIHLGSGIEIMLFAMALTYKVNMLKQSQERAVSEQLRLSEANERLILEQNVQLEEKVNQRTQELNQQKMGLQTTLAQLRATQDQLIQREKMASLGELMAGIAHEIQNPLNFVNNFSEVSVDMLGELKEEIAADRKVDALAIADELVPNLEKISHHGKRAGSIVRSMLQHSQSSKGNHQPTDLNALADEYLRLTYQGMRVKDIDFNVKLTAEFDANMGLVNLMPQEIARVLLNLYNNAFYAVREKSRQQGNTLGYQPEVWVRTHRQDSQVSVVVKDNGIGIPQEILTKIYQPFFTTKPTGEGTGLGLSLSYDIITMGHGGELVVRTEPGQFAEFEIRLPSPGVSNG
ncbi:sensor histidine kinase [Spirosoma aerophilum]